MNAKVEAEQADFQTDSPMIEVRGLCKMLDRKPILAGVDLRIEHGEVLALVGRSGSGKSVLLKHLIGLMRPDSGDVLIEGKSILLLSERRLSPIRKRVSYLFQGGALFDSMSVGQNIAFPLRESGVREEAELERRVAEALELVDLSGEEAKMPGELSGGMRKRVALARSIVYRPACILYDEPTTGLDPVNSGSINRLIRRMQERFGVTSVVVTHDMKTVWEVSNRVAYLMDGQIRFLGTPDALRASEDPEVRGFIEGKSDEERL